MAILPSDHLEAFRKEYEGGFPTHKIKHFLQAGLELNTIFAALGDELAQDILRCRAHNYADACFALVYDPEKYILNASGFEQDFRADTSFPVRVVILQYHRTPATHTMEDRWGAREHSAGIRRSASLASRRDTYRARDTGPTDATVAVGHFVQILPVVTVRSAQQFATPRKRYRGPAIAQDSGPKWRRT